MNAFRLDIDRTICLVRHNSNRVLLLFRQALGFHCFFLCKFLDETFPLSAARGSWSQTIASQRTEGWAGLHLNSSTWWSCLVLFHRRHWDNQTRQVLLSPVGLNCSRQVQHLQRSNNTAFSWAASFQKKKERNGWRVGGPLHVRNPSSIPTLPQICRGCSPHKKNPTLLQKRSACFVAAPLQRTARTGFGRLSLNHLSDSTSLCRLKPRWDAHL